MPRPVISVENLSKAYRIGLKEEIPDTLAGAFTGFLKSPFRNLRQLSRLDTFRHQADSEDIFWALKDVSFEVQEGEVLGVIGRNGAGKSTLLKILSRITEPTSGRAVIRGRVSSLLEVGTGFHPELSGRENVYLNGTILGMTKAEIDRKFDEIVDFSGVEKFLDTPIKRYSSGMKVRLAFAVAAHLEPEILIIDEVLAVGDAEFQKKCLGKMQDVASHGRTVLFVSHQLDAVTDLCTQGLLLHNGSLSLSSNVDAVVSCYLSLGGNYSGDLQNRIDRGGSGPLRFNSVTISSSPNAKLPARLGHPLYIDIAFSGDQPPTEPVEFAAGVYSSSGARLAWLGNVLTTGPFESLHQSGNVSCVIPTLPLLPGTYSLNIECRIGETVSDWIQQAIRFDVLDGTFYPNGAAPPNNWGHFAMHNNWSHKSPA